MNPAVTGAYGQPEPSDGTRVLVDRLWPGGLARDHAALDDWPRDVAPSDVLCRWYWPDPRPGSLSSPTGTGAELSDGAHAEALARLRAYLRAGPRHAAHGHPGT